MPYKYEWIEPEIFMSYKGADVYYIHKNDMADEPVRLYAYALDPESALDSFIEDTFDIRNIDGFDSVRINDAGYIENLIAGALESGELKHLPGYENFNPNADVIGEEESGPVYQSINHYIEATASTAKYPGDFVGRMNYCCHGIQGEIGEIHNKFKKILRGDSDDKESRLSALLAEVGDVYWYLARIVVEANLAKTFSWNHYDGQMASIMAQEHRDSVPEVKILVLSSLLTELSDAASSMTSFVYRECHKLEYNRPEDVFEDTYRRPDEGPELITYCQQLFRILASICCLLGSSAEDVCQANMTKLFNRNNKGSIKGDGDFR